MQQTKNTRRGFTLIELLVVVLIIAVLSAVAVPQYQLAVDKAQLRKIQASLEVVMQSVKRYILATGSFPTSFHELDISLPADCTITDDVTSSHPSTANCTKDAISWYLYPLHQSVYVTLPHVPSALFQLIGYRSASHNYGIGHGTRVCAARSPKSAHQRYNRLCAGVGTETTDSTTWIGYDLPQ